MSTSLNRSAALAIGLMLYAAVVLSFATPVARAEDVPVGGVGDATSTPADSGNNGNVATSSNDGTGGLTGGKIHTGDATATTSVQNQLNTNTTNPDSACDPLSPNEDEQCTNSSVITSTSTNNAVANVTSTTTAGTGDNTANGAGLALVVTGKAIAVANIINLINTNIFNSKGLIIFLNDIFGTGLDLRNFNLEYFFDGQAGNSPTTDTQGNPQCTILTCLNSSGVTVENQNDAAVHNEVIVRANTGDNEATSTGPDLVGIDGAGIQTGNAYAAANVLNLVNTNVIDSSYLMVSYNNFGTLDGNISLPGGSFFDKLFEERSSVPAMNSSSYGANNTNNGDATSTVNVGADTGNNLASTSGMGSGFVSTGDAHSMANNDTLDNVNIIGGTSVFLMFRVAGVWHGAIKGLPNNLTPVTIESAQEKDGVISTSTLVLITNKRDDVDLTAPSDANCETPNDPNNPEHTPINNCYNSSTFLASSTNNAHLDNDVDVQASTGDNFAFSQDGISGIVTGDAYAVANITNLMNSNLVGANWVFALFNVFGDWNGDVNFGKSELGVEAQPQVNGAVVPGALVNYVFTITNNGDGEAGNVKLEAKYDKDYLSFDDGSVIDGGRRWNVGDIPRGESRTFTYQARVTPGQSSKTIPLNVTVESDDAAGFTIGTLDVLAPASNPPSGGGSTSSGGSSHSGGGGGGSGTKAKAFKAPTKGFTPTKAQAGDPKLTIETTAVLSATTTPTTVDYKMVVTNAKDGGALYNAVLGDTIIDPNGVAYYQRSWALDTLAPGDQIILTYSMSFPATSTPGNYVNTASVSGNLYSGKAMSPFSKQTSVNVSPYGAMVLGDSTQNACSQTLKGYITKTGPNGLLDVISLQMFLNTFAGESLLVTGMYDATTTGAVNRFQLAHASEILTPQGLSTPTGNVMGGTLRIINRVACGGVDPVSAVVPVAPAPVSVVPAYKPVVVVKKPVALIAKPAPKPAAAVATAPAAAPAPAKAGVVSWFAGLFH